jgi:hypothetical protein
MSDNPFRLRIQSGSETGRTIVLAGDSLVIGRYPLADIVINEPGVAYRHAVLTRSGGVYRLADLDSDGGTYVNGRRIVAEPVALTPGDIILLGSQLSLAFLEEPQLTAEAAEPELPTEEEVAPAASVVEAEVVESEYEPPPPTAATVNEAVVGPTPQPAEPTHHAGPLPAMPPPQKVRTGRLLWIAAGCLVLLLACCCSATLFMYFIGGDWLLNLLR